MEIWQNWSALSCCFVRGYTFVDSQTQDTDIDPTNLTAKSQLYIHGVSALERDKRKKKKDSFAFQSVRVRFRESIRLRECVNTEFSWEAKKGNWRKSLLEESWQQFIALMKGRTSSNKRKKKLHVW